MFSPGGEPEASSWGRCPLTRGVNGQGWGARRLSGRLRSLRGPGCGRREQKCQVWFAVAKAYSVLWGKS